MDKHSDGTGSRAKTGLLALVLLAAGLPAGPSAAQAQGARFAISAFVVEGNTLLPDAVVNGTLVAFVGKERGIDDINAAAEALRKAYDAAGFPVVKVFPPPQATDTGRIRLSVVEGEVDKVVVKGNAFYDEANIRASVPPLQERTKPNIRQIVAAIATANENPSKQIAVNFQAAEKLGDIDAVINVTEENPRKATMTLDNAGSRSTGPHRLSLGFQDANLFNKDHILTAQYATSASHPRSTQQISGGYRIPLYGPGLSVDLIGSYSESAATTEVGFGNTLFNGRGNMAGLRLNHALPSAGELRHRLIYGLDYKDFNNTCTGVNAGTCGTVTAQPVSIAYSATLRNPAYEIGATLTYLTNWRGGAHGSEQEYALARAGAEPSWSAWRANASISVPLPRDLQFRAALNGQGTGDRLVPAEQFGIGGAASVRGFAERTTSGDRGYGGNLEIYSPDFGKHLHDRLSLRALVFLDFGEAEAVSPIRSIGEGRTRISSIGFGFRVNRGRDLAVRIDTGLVQQGFASAPSTGTARSSGDYFTHISLSYQF